jgi:hypothetical protein
MPLRTQCLYHRVRNRLSTLSTFGAEAVGMASHTPSVPLLLDKRRRRVKRITALSAKEVSNVPLGATSYHDLTLDRRLTAFASGREELVEVEMAIETHALVKTVLTFQTLHVLICGVGGQEFDVFTALASVDAGDAFSTLVVRFRIEGYAF